MTGWIFLAMLAAVTVVAVRYFARLPKGGFELVLAAVLTGIAGYAWQGNPDQDGAPVQSEEKGVTLDTKVIATRRMMTNTYGDAAKVADFADLLDRWGKTREAVIAVQTGLRKEPKNPELWTSLGNALVVHGGGILSPAAELAYARAQALAPDHPAPAYFRGLALAQSGRIEEAAQSWGGLLIRSPKDAPWREDVEARLALALRIMQAEKR